MITVRSLLTVPGRLVGLETYRGGIPRPLVVEVQGHVRGLEDCRGDLFTAQELAREIARIHHRGRAFLKVQQGDSQVSFCLRLSD